MRSNCVAEALPAARNIELRKVSSRVTATSDVREVLGDALLAGGVKYSAIFDMLANPTEININRKI